MQLSENDLVNVVEELRLKGYTETFILKDNQIYATGLNSGFSEKEVTIEGAYQFDITEEAFDTQNLFAIWIPDHDLRGLLIDLLGMYLYTENQPISQILRDAPMETYIFDDDNPHNKYGLRKISPSEFTSDSERYILRVGFPDFPECPVGTNFSMLGFDTQNQEYVWLVTSILNHHDLKRVNYKKTDDTSDPKG